MKELPRRSGGAKINMDSGIGFPTDDPLTFTYKIGGVAVDNTTYTAKFEIRENDGGTGTELLALTVGSGITLGGADGIFTVVITPAQANFGSSLLRYAMVVYTSGGSPICLARGDLQNHNIAAD